MEIEIFNRLSGLAAGLGYFIGLFWCFFSKSSPFCKDSVIERFAGSAISALVSSFALWLIITIIYWAAYGIYYGITGG